MIELHHILELQVQIKKKKFHLLIYLVQMKKIRMNDKVRMTMIIKKIMITSLLMRKVLNFVMNIKINGLIVYNVNFNLVNL